MELRGIVLVLIFVSANLASGRLFYVYHLKSYAKRKAKSLGFDILKMDFSFEQMVYFLTLPSSLPAVKKAKPQDIKVEIDYGSFFFPKVAGIKVKLRNASEEKILAYLPIKDFRLPQLDQLLERREIDEAAYLKMATYKLIHSNTLQEISEEVYNHIKKDAI